MAVTQIFTNNEPSSTNGVLRMRHQVVAPVAIPPARTARSRAIPAQACRTARAGLPRESPAKHRCITLPRMPSTPPSSHAVPLVSHECRVCGTVLSGPGGAILRLIGIARSRRNPNICTRCNTHFESGQMLEVTVLFADLSGFTAMTHELGPERAHEVVDAFLKVASREVMKEDGFVDKFIGDAVMAVFNAPISRPDHAVAAFRAAMAIQRAMPGLSASHGRTLHATVGIANGYARLGTPGGSGAGDHTLLGDVVNLAARLQSRAQAGDVIVDEYIYGALQGEAGEVPEERLDLRGFPAPVACRRFGPGVRTSLPTTERQQRRSALGLSAVAFALLGAPCAATVALTPVALWLGVVAATGAGGVSLFGWLDQSWIRVPALSLAALAAVANLAAVHRASRLRRERPQGGFRPPSEMDRRRTRWATALSIITLLIIVAERIAHVHIHPYG